MADDLNTLAGKGTLLHSQLGIFLNIVSMHTPFLAHRPEWNAMESL